MKKHFLANTLMLTLTSQLLRVAGIFMTAYLTSRIGAEGVGLYQLILSVYSLAAVLASSGIGSTVARLIAESLGKSGGKSVSDVLRRAIFVSVALGIVTGAAVYLLADFFGTSLLSDARAVPAIRMLAAGLPFMALSSCMQGYFFGVRKAMQPSAQMLFEQAVRIGLTVAVLDMFIARGLAASCFAIILCCMISEALSCAFAFLLYAIHVRRSRIAVRHEADIGRQMLRIAAPLALTGYLRAALRTAENILIPSGLRAYGATEARALSQYAQVGMAAMVLFFPSGLLGAAATLLMPEVSEARAAKRTPQVHRIFSRTFQFTVLYSLLISALLLSLGQPLGSALFPNTEAGQLIAALAPLVPLMYLDFVVDSLLTGLGEQMRTLRINTVDYAIRITLILLLIPRLGFVAYVVVVYVSTLFNAVLSIRRLLIASGCRVRYPEWVLGPLLCAAIAGVAASLLQKLLLPGMDIAGALLKAGLMTGLYFALLRVTRCLTREDVAWVIGIVRRKPARES